MDDLHQQGAHHGLSDRASSAEQARASDHDGGDRHHLETCARYRLSSAEPRSEYKTRETTKKTADRVHAELDQIDVDSRRPGGIFVATHGVNVATEPGTV